MKTLLVTLILAATACIISCNANTTMNDFLQKSKCPIKKETTAIRYIHTTNSGIAVQTEYNIMPDSMTWHYTDHRNGFILSDVIRYDRKDYDALIDTLTQISFKVHHVNSIPTSGGGGYSYAFFDNEGRYLGYGVTNNVATGNNAVAEKAISLFIDTHQTAGEKAVKEAKEKRLLYIDMDEFPEILEPFKVKEHHNDN